MGFQSETYKLSWGVYLGRQEKEQEEVLSEVKEYRGILLGSFIVRVMKTREEFEHESLIGEVIGLVNSSSTELSSNSELKD